MRLKLCALCLSSSDRMGGLRAAGAAPFGGRALSHATTRRCFAGVLHPPQARPPHHRPHAQAYADYNDLIKMTEEMISGLVFAIRGTHKIQYHPDGPDGRVSLTGRGGVGIVREPGKGHARIGCPLRLLCPVEAVSLLPPRPQP